MRPLCAWTRTLAVPVLLLALAACAKNGERAAEAGATAADAAVASPEGAFLAYEHDVQVQLEAAQIAPRIQQIARPARARSSATVQCCRSTSAAASSPAVK